MNIKIFVNLPVKNLDKTIEFFTKLDFKFNPQFTDKNATCMIIGEDIYAMLLVEKFFKTFIKKEICDASKYSEVITALFVDSKEKVNELVNKAFKAGGIRYRDPEDLGFMYSWAFQDLDGHLWEVGWMDLAHFQPIPAENKPLKQINSSKKTKTKK